MIGLLLDTHSLVWLLFADARLPERVRQFIEQLLRDGGQVGCSTISLVELVYLVEKGKLHPSVWERTSQLLESFQSPLREVPLTRAVVQRLQEVSREQIPDMPDRIIAATALQLGVPLVSRDRKIVATGLETLWD